MKQRIGSFQEKLIARLSRNKETAQIKSEMKREKLQLTYTEAAISAERGSDTMSAPGMGANEGRGDQGRRTLPRRLQLN